MNDEWPFKMPRDDPRHGENRGYIAHVRKFKESACRPCMDARARYQRLRTYDALLGRPRTVPAFGVHRRVHALQRLGWSLEKIAHAGGWNSAEALQYVMKSKSITRRTWERVDKVYRELSMTLPPFTSGSVRARRYAERMGYPPPLAWDDIDDPDEFPRGYSVRDSKPGKDDLDHAVVQRRLSGDKSVSMTHAERVEIIRQAFKRGWSFKRIESVTGLKPDPYLKELRGAAS